MSLETSFYVDLDYEDPSKNVQFQDLLDSYFDKFVCGKEVSKSGVQHYQCWVFHEKDTNAYTNFIAKCKKMFNLQGRATKHKRKQYGKIRGVIRDTDNMISYCLKEHDYTYKGLEDEYVSFRETESYEKEDTNNDKFKHFIERCREDLPMSMPTDPDNGPVQAYQDRLGNAIIISKVWYEVYDTVIPRTMINKVLLVLGLVTHDELAARLFMSYIGPNPITAYS